MEEIRQSGFDTCSRMDPGYRSPILEQILQDPDRFIRSGARILKHDQTTTVALLENDDSRWVIKRYNTKNPWHALRRTVRRSRAVNCWEMSEILQRAGVSVPGRIACIEARFGPLRSKSYFINEYIEADNIFTYITGNRDNREKEAAAQRSIELFEKLQAGSINHGDMKATNILVSDGELVLLDFDAARSPADKVSFEKGYTKDRSRFLKNWIDHPLYYERFDSELPR